MCKGRACPGPRPRPAPARPGGARVSRSHELPASPPGPGPRPSSLSPAVSATGCPLAWLPWPAALPAPTARNGAVEQPPPAPGPWPSSPGARHGAPRATAPRAAGLGRCGHPLRAAPAGTMSPLLRSLLLAALLQLAPAQVRASPPVPSQGWRKWGRARRSGVCPGTRASLSWTLSCVTPSLLRPAVGFGGFGSCSWQGHPWHVDSRQVGPR